MYQHYLQGTPLYLTSYLFYIENATIWRTIRQISVITMQQITFTINRYPSLRCVTRYLRGHLLHTDILGQTLFLTAEC